MADISTHTALATAPSPAATRVKKDQRRAWFLLTPGLIWMALFMVLPMCMVVYVSFWTQTTFAVEPTLTTTSWERFLSSSTYLGAIGTTLRVWAIVLVATIAVGYPVDPPSPRTPAGLDDRLVRR